MTTAPLHAVHDDELLDFLKSLGILADVQAGRTHCAFCNAPVTLRNLNAVFPQSGAVRVACAQPSCVKALMQHLSEG